MKNTEKMVRVCESFNSTENCCRRKTDFQTKGIGGNRFSKIGNEISLSVPYFHYQLEQDNQR